MTLGLIAAWYSKYPNNIKGVGHSINGMTGATSSKTYGYMMTALAGLAVIFVVLIAALAWPVADDFSNFIKLRGSSGPVDYAVMQYKNWDGRFLNYLIWGFITLKPEYVNVNVMLYAACFIGIAFMLMTLVENTAFYPAGAGRAYFFLVMLAALWLGMRPLESETLYWASGAVQYTVIPLLGLVWLCVIYELLFKPVNIPAAPVTVPLFLIFSFFIGTGNPVYSPALFFLALVMRAFAPEKKYMRLFTAACVLFAAGAVLMYAAPGNFVRAAEDRAETFVFSPVFLVSNFFKVAWSFIKAGRYLILLSFLGAAAFGGYAGLYGKGNGRAGQLRAVFTYAYFVAAILSVLPFILVPNFASLRASVFFQIFSALFIWHLVSYAGGRLRQFFPGPAFRAYVFGLPVVFAVMLYIFAAGDVYYGMGISRQMKERDASLKKAAAFYGGRKKYAVLRVKPVTGRVPASMAFDDIKPYTNDFRNKGVAAYYGFLNVYLSESA